MYTYHRSLVFYFPFLILYHWTRLQACTCSPHPWEDMGRNITTKCVAVMSQNKMKKIKNNVKKNLVLAMLYNIYIYIRLHQMESSCTYKIIWKSLCFKIIISTIYKKIYNTKWVVYKINLDELCVLVFSWTPFPCSSIHCLKCIPCRVQAKVLGFLKVDCHNFIAGYKFKSLIGKLCILVYLLVIRLIN